MQHCSHGPEGPASWDCRHHLPDKATGTETFSGLSSVTRLARDRVGFVAGCCGHWLGLPGGAIGDPMRAAGGRGESEAKDLCNLSGQPLTFSVPQFPHQ